MAEVLSANAMVFALAIVLTGLLRRLLTKYGVVDTPNGRSSHSIPTPRGGGVSIMLAATAGLIGLAVIGFTTSKLITILVIGGSILTLVGFLDDHRRLHPTIKLAAHIAVATWTVISLGGPPALVVLDGTVMPLGFGGYVLSVLAIVWVINLFNFMDGIDGLAASEAVFVTFAAAGLTLLLPVSRALSTADVTLGFACLGFLAWNWPPARIFMGDVGSGYLGYAIAVLALAAGRQSPVSLWGWLILGGTFFVDATVALIRRAARRERVFEAHRIHAYQWLARRWGSHRRVTLTVMILNVVWLLPCALFATWHPEKAVVTVAVAFVPLVVLALAAGSGRPECANRLSPQCGLPSHAAEAPSCDVITSRASASRS